MAASARWTAAAIVAALVVPIGISETEAAGGRVRLRLRDHSRTDPVLLYDARALAVSILADAGVSSFWDAEPSGPDDPRDPADEIELDVHLLGPRTTRLSAGESALGLAVVGPGEPSHTAFVFQDRVLAYAGRHRLDAGRLLGHVIAHEVGHLLLASTTHAATGLMRGHWTPALLKRGAGGAMRFSESEGAAMRQRLVSSAAHLAHR
jgi:hypothetical protein